MEAFNLRADTGLTFKAAAFRMQGLEVEALPLNSESNEDWEVVISWHKDLGWVPNPFFRFADSAASTVLTLCHKGITDLDWNHPSAPAESWPLVIVSN